MNRLKKYLTIMLLLGLTIKDAMFIFRGPNRLTP